MHPSSLSSIFFMSVKSFIFACGKKKNRRNFLQTRSANGQTSERESKVKGKKVLKLEAKKRLSNKLWIKVRKIKKIPSFAFKMKNEY